MRRSFIIYNITRHFYSDKIKNELGGACSTYGTNENAYSMLVGKSERKTSTRKTKAWRRGR
jgi:hypothetical protein